MITMFPVTTGFFRGYFILYFLVFAFILGTFIYFLREKFRQDHKNDNSPRLTSEATVVAKRTHVRGDHSYTTYYATFQFASGDRLELQVPYSQFGYLVEGDHGKLTFQGTRFVSFERV